MNTIVLVLLASLLGPVTSSPAKAGVAATVDSQCTYQIASEGVPSIFRESRCFGDFKMPPKPKPIPPSDPIVPSHPGGMPLPPPFIGEKWWQVGWTGGRSPYAHQPFNAGWSFYNYSSSENSPERYISYMGGSDYMGGAVVQAWAATKSWDRIVGGPLANGPNQITRNSQLDFANSAQTRYWWASADRYPDMWLGIYLVTAPSGNGGISEDQFYSNWQDIVAGRHDADYVMMGRRLRWFIETQSIYGKMHNRPEQVILRPNWEFTQDTSLGLSFIRYLMENKRMSFAQAAKFYADGMWRFASSIRQGYNQDYENKVRLRIAFAPAQQTKFGPMTEYLRHWPDTYDMIDLMNHPSKFNTGSTMDGARENLFGLSSRKHTYAEALAASAAYNLAIGSLEWSPRKESENYVMPNRGVYEYSIRLFYELLAANSSRVAFTGAFHPSLVTEGFLSGTANGADWQRTVRAHKEYFGAR